LYSLMTYLPSRDASVIDERSSDDALILLSVSGDGTTT